ncbi:hypothetical protein [Leifsonia sp. Leaf264]|uniref:hypothetical protein n=1 Tax=Leifsonia sp. Leaf264 TaxID=1736314 RepID=UPI0006F24363|nr:hypothetical protein [Leifsonia sp. Leaf264]KQO98442.1 hypothetical protein ASF30_10295 [Leifsonia sp. Leaf264]
MAMSYEAALKQWGADKLNRYGDTVDPADVTVTMNFETGYACCGGRDPGCYCSNATDPVAEVLVDGGGRKRYRIDLQDFDFVSVLAEIIEAGGGTVTSA